MTHGAAEFAGLAGGLATGTGEAALMEAAGKKLAPLAESTIGKLAVRGAAENAIYQGGDEISQMINGNPQQTVGTAIADVGLSAAIGGALGGAFGGVSSLWKAANGTKVGQELANFGARFKERTLNPDPAAALHEELQNLHNALSPVNDVYGPEGIKAQAIKEGIPEIKKPIVDQVTQINDALDDSLGKLKNDPHLGLMQDAVNDYRAKVATPGWKNSAGIYDATNELKQQLQELSKYNKWETPPLSERKFIAVVRDTASGLKENLEDSSVWGKAADVQKSINQAFAGTSRKSWVPRCAQRLPI